MAVEELPLRWTLAYSAAASLLARVACHPMDTLKARLQAEGSKALYRSTWGALQHAVRFESPAALYRGFGAVAVVGTPAGMLYLTSYEWFIKVADRWQAQQAPGARLPDAAVHFAGGLFAEAVACSLFLPVDVVKERMQVPGSPHASSLACAQNLVRADGAAALYRGFGVTLLSFGTYSGLYFVLYEALKRRVDFGPAGGATAGARPPTFFEALCASAGAGAAAAWLTSPLDLAKLRYQVDTAEQRRGFCAILADVTRTDGLAGLFRGANARAAFFAPSTAIFMASFETLKANHHRP
ncbi:mitochondrial carrier domain-containing protein [Pelagophyceae sp. CCMP2097]|nr:mitochondrial carrier domain-containing protein [Pelagophyceae sp. CCMP2097]